MQPEIVEEEWADADIARAIVLGAAIGVPLMFVITALLTFIGDVSLWKSAGVAALPAAFVGPYIGGLATMGATAARHEHHVASAGDATVDDEQLAA